MASVKDNKEEMVRLVLNARHLPQTEYNRLDELMIYPNDTGTNAAIYDCGVMILILDRQEDYLSESFPVLNSIMRDLDYITLFDFYESGNIMDDLKLFDWEE